VIHLARTLVIVLSTGCVLGCTSPVATKPSFDAARPPVDATMSIGVRSIEAATPLLRVLAPLAKLVGVEVDLEQLQSAQLDVLGVSRQSPVWLHLRPTMAVVTIAIDPNRFAAVMLAAPVQPLLANTWTTVSSPTQMVWTLHGDQLVVAVAGDTGHADGWATAAYLLAWVNDDAHRLTRPVAAPSPPSSSSMLATWWTTPKLIDDAGASQLQVACNSSGVGFQCTSTAIVAGNTKAAMIDRALRLPAPAAWCAVAPHHAATLIVPPLDDLSALLSSLSGVDGGRWRGPVVVAVRRSQAEQPDPNDWLTWLAATVVATPASPEAVDAMTADLEAAPRASKRTVGTMEVHSIAAPRTWRSVHMAVDRNVFAASFGDALAIDAIAAHPPCPSAGGLLLDIQGEALAELLARGGSPLAPWLAEHGVVARSSAVAAVGHLTAVAKMDGHTVVVAWSGG
jgi:hypothetical protein